MFLVISLGNERRTGLEQRNAQTALCEDLGSGASRGAGADNANIISLGRAPNLHGPPSEFELK
jgi:hypothetical protein